MFCCDGIEHLAAGLARRQALGIWGERWNVSVPAIRRNAPLHAIDLLCQLGMFGAVIPEEALPAFTKLAAALANALREMLAHAVRHKKFGVFRPTVIFLGKPDFVFTERLAMRGAGVLLVRSPVADMAVHNDQGWGVV